MEKMKILLVDDEEDFVTTLSERLFLRGYDVKTAFNPVDAMPLIYSYKPHLVILDIKMPQMNGIEFLRFVKKINPKIEVFILSAFGNKGYVEEALKIGALEYVLKPIDINELIIKIERVREKIKNEGG